ncbi:MAG TPA: hypothetical protein VIH21_11570 [Dehalococcoidia bacterium]|jgi:hypothetical protein
MVFRRREQESDDIKEDQEDGLNIISDDDEEDDEEPIFIEGQSCWVCSEEVGRVGLDPTCHGMYDGQTVLLGFNCLDAALKDAYAANDGIAAIVEPFGDNKFHLYYRLDEMPAYQFPREDIEPISWLLLTIGDNCARCGEQSHYAWLTPDFVDPELPEEEDRAVFRNLDRDAEHLCAACTATALAASYRKLDLPLMTVELPRGAMGILMPSGA